MALTTPLGFTIAVHVQCNQAAYTVNPLLQNIYVYKLQLIYVHNIIQQTRFIMLR